MSRIPNRTAHQLSLARASFLELKMVVKKILRRYPEIQNTLDPVDYKILKDAKIFESEEISKVENPCLGCGVEVGKKSRCSKCYLKWKKEKRDGNR